MSKHNRCAHSSAPAHHARAEPDGIRAKLLRTYQARDGRGRGGRARCAPGSDPLKSNLMVLMDCELTSGLRLAVPEQRKELPDVQQSSTDRYRIVPGAGASCRICARRGTWGARRICAPCGFGGNGKCADQWYSARPGERRRIVQHGGRSERRRQCVPNGEVATAAHRRPDAAGRHAKSGRGAVDEFRPASAAGGTGRRACPAACRSSAIGERPDESERSNQSGERGARPHDRWHLSRLLGRREVASITSF